MSPDAAAESVPLLKASIAAGHPARLTVVSSSMRPFLLPKDIVVCIAPHRLRPGDCVAYGTPQGIVTHRVLRVSSRGVIVKGDANRTPDEPVAHERIIGMVVALERDGARVWHRGPDTDLAARTRAWRSSLHALLWRIVYTFVPRPAATSAPAPAPLEIAARNIVLLERANAVALAARERRIEIIALKGIRYLCGIVRADARPISDIDLLVRHGDVPALRAVLAAQGYRCAAPLWRKHRPRSRWLNAEVWRTASPVPHFVHLHWDLTNSTLPLSRPRFDIDGIFSRSVPLGGEGIACRALAPADECVYAAFHAFVHGYDRPQIADDIRRVFAYHACARHALVDAARAAGASVPLAHAFAVIDGTASPDGGHNRFLRELARMQGGRAAQVLFFLGIVFAPPAVIRALFPETPLPAAYCSRILRAVFRHGIC